MLSVRSDDKKAVAFLLARGRGGVLEWASLERRGGSGLPALRTKMVHYFGVCHLPASWHLFPSRRMAVQVMKPSSARDA